MIKVVKFGGSSLADAAQMKKVRQIILQDHTRRYVVPSAPGKRSYTDEKVTDLLYAAQRAVANEENSEPIFEKIQERYLQIASQLGLGVNIAGALAEVRRRILDGASSDYAASRGEYLNALLLSDYLGYDMVDAAEFICFDDKGRFDEKLTQQKGAELLKQHEKAVIPGFYGAMPDGEIKTFSRGGSDISGAIVARAVNAALYENWTDVNGFLMADPRVVSNPQTISKITYTELRELAYMGATVLHEEAIFPVRQACIPISVKNTNCPEDEGTLIVADASDNDGEFAITGVAGRKGFTVFALEKDQMNTEIGFAANVLRVLADNDVSIEHMPTGIDTLSVVVSNTLLDGKRQKIADEIIDKCNPDSLEIQENMALIAVVGRGMINRIGTSARIFSALAMADVNIRMIDQGSSELNIIVGVEADDFNTAVNAIYTAFAK